MFSVPRRGADPQLVPDRPKQVYSTVQRETWAENGPGENCENVVSWKYKNNYEHASKAPKWPEMAPINKMKSS